jgi:putative Holliday junction resolvase
MKFLGIDYGRKKIGLSVSDQDGRLAFPKAVFPNDDDFLPKLLGMIASENISGIVVGESVNFSGQENPISKDIERFIRSLEEKTKIPVHKEKEFFTSVEARRYSGEGQVDHSAAALILQRFLDRLNNSRKAGKK